MKYILMIIIYQFSNHPIEGKNYIEESPNIQMQEFDSLKSCKTAEDLINTAIPLGFTRVRKRDHKKKGF